MNIWFYILCVTFFLSFFILKFKWFKKIGSWLAKPFIKHMKKKRVVKKDNQVVTSEKSDRFGKSNMQIRPVVLPPQLNSPAIEQDKKETKEKEDTKIEKPMTMKEAFGDNDPFETRPIFPMAQENYAKENSSHLSLGTKYSQNWPNNPHKKQDKISLDFLNSATKGLPRTSFSQQDMSYIKSGKTFDKQGFLTESRKNFSQGRASASSLGNGAGAYGFSLDNGKLSTKGQNFSNAADGIKMTNFGGRNATRRTADMDAIISKRKREFEDYKRQKDSVNIDGKEVDMAGLPPKLKRILVMGILDKKNYD